MSFIQTQRRGDEKRERAMDGHGGHVRELEIKVNKGKMKAKVAVITQIIEK